MRLNKILETIEKITKNNEKIDKTKIINELKKILYKANNKKDLKRIIVKLENNDLESLKDFVKVLIAIFENADFNEKELVIEQISSGCWEIIIAASSFILSLIMLLFNHKISKENAKHQKSIEKNLSDIKKILKNQKNDYKKLKVKIRDKEQIKNEANNNNKTR